jgi:DNA-binding NtrC family response regulator
MVMGADRRILIVDDDPAVLMVFRDTLRGLGESHEIVTAQNGLDALEAFRKKPFDLIITDMKMPGMDGVQLTEHVKAHSPETSVIWVTAHGAYNYAADAQRLGVIYCIDKPLEVWQILQLAKDALSDDE